MRLVYRTEPPHYWGIYGKDCHLLESGRADSLDELPAPAQGAQIIAVVPGERVMPHRVENPTRSRKTLQQALPNQLEPELADDIGSLHFAVLDWQRGQGATVAVIDREYLRDLLARLVQAGLAPEILMPEYFMLPAEDTGIIALGYAEDHSILLRDGRYGGMSMDPDMFDLWMGSLPREQEIKLYGEGLEALLLRRDRVSMVSVEPSNDPLVWLEGRNETFPNVLQGEFIAGRDKARLGLRPAWIMLAAGLLLWLAIDVGEYVHLQRQNATLDRQLGQAFHQAFPRIKRIVNIRQQAKTEVAHLQAESTGQQSYFVILDAIAKALKGSGATVQSIDYRQGEVALYAQLPDYALADQLKLRFDKDARIRTQLVPSGSSAGVVSVRYNISLANS